MRLREVERKWKGGGFMYLGMDARYARSGLSLLR
jgi:hypothetical protein